MHYEHTKRYNIKSTSFIVIRNANYALTINSLSPQCVAHTPTYRPLTPPPPR